MHTPIVAAMLDFEGIPGVAVDRRSEKIELRVHRDGAQVVVTVPTGVLEWFASATEVSTGKQVSDWCDYEGHDDSPQPELVIAMRDDVVRFLGALLDRRLRFRRAPTLFGRKLLLEWAAGDERTRALPFGAE